MFQTAKLRFTGNRNIGWRERNCVVNKSLVRLIVAMSIMVLTMGLSTYHAGAFTTGDLTLGSRGYDVYELQNRLRFIGYYWGRIDGDFSWDTYWAVRTFQYNFRIPVTGDANEETKIKLTRSTGGWHYSSPTKERSVQSSGSLKNTRRTMVGHSSPPMDTIPNQIQGLTRSDMNLLAHVVYAEARGETFRGQVAIAAVILNRISKPQFPHTIPGIIYQPGAFTSIQDGQVNLPPDPTAYQAVMAAVHGWDPSMGAIYYFNPATAISPWIWSRPQIITIGHHIFCD